MNISKDDKIEEAFDEYLDRNGYLLPEQKRKVYWEWISAFKAGYKAGSSDNKNNEEIEK